MSENKTLTGKFSVSPPAPVACLYAVDEYLYAGSATNGYLYRTLDGYSYEEFWRTGEVAVTSVMEYGDALFVGTAVDGKIFMHNFTTGNRFHYVTTGDYEVSAMALFNGLLYVGTKPGGMVLSFNGDRWSKEYEAYGSGIESMSVWNNRLHLFVAGTQTIPYVDADGSWSFMREGDDVFSVSGKSPVSTSLDPLLIPKVFDSGFAESAVFNGMLMFVGGERKKIYSFDGTTVKIEFQSTTGDITGLEVVGGTQLYLAAGDTVYIHEIELTEEDSESSESDDETQSTSEEDDG